MNFETNFNFFMGEEIITTEWQDDNKTHRRFAFTDFVLVVNESGEKVEPDPTLYVGPEYEDRANSKVKRYVYQYERCPTTNKFHIQGYIEFESPVRKPHVKRVLGKRAHFRPARSNGRINFEYCTKERTRIPGTESCIFGNWTNEQGKRSDLLVVVEKIQEGIPMKQIAKEHPVTYIRYNKGMEKLEQKLHEGVARDGKWENYWKARWFYGKTHCGKTEEVAKRHGGWDYVYVKDPYNKWWDGFNPSKHLAILIDDYPAGEITSIDGMNFEKLLKLCSPNPFNGEVKTREGGADIGKQIIYITSNHTMATVFGNHSNYDALERRFTEKEFIYDKAKDPRVPKVKPELNEEQKKTLEALEPPMINGIRLQNPIIDLSN